jgi:hypothetical protein
MNRLLLKHDQRAWPWMRTIWKNRPSCDGNHTMLEELS